MDYEEAKDRLDKPRKKNSKNIGHELVLRRGMVKEGGGSFIYLRYFRTDIITWFPDGSVQINDGGFASSSYTVEKINSYLPKNWYLTPSPVHKGVFTAVLHKVGVSKEGWGDLWAYPYEPDSTFTEEGRTDLMPSRSFNALETKAKIAAYAKKNVDDLMHGRLSGNLFKIEEMEALDRSFARSSPKIKKERLCLDVLEQKLVPPITFLSFIGMMAARHSFYLPSYWSENFPYTSSRKNKTLRQEADDLEFRLSKPEVLKRPLENSSEHHAMTSFLTQKTEEVLLKGLGFGVFERQSFGHMRAFGR